MTSGEGSLSLNERLENAITRLGFWYRVTLIMVIVGLVSLSGIISASQFYFHQEIGKYGHIQEIELKDATTSVLAYIPYTPEVFPTDAVVTLYLTQIWLTVGNGIVIGLLSFLFIWVTFRGHGHRKELESIERQFIRQSYLINFETSIPEGENRVAKVLNQASLVFPTLIEIQRKKYANKMRIRLNETVGSETVDAIVETRKGDFIIKFYEKVVSFEDIKSLCQNLSKSRPRIFRVLIVTKEFEEELQSNKLVDLMDSLLKYFKVDLIFEEEQGYSMLWID